MKPLSLTSKRVSLEDGTLAFPYEWNGATVLIRNDTASVLEVIQLFANQDLLPEEKSGLIIETFFVSPEVAINACECDLQDFTKLLIAAVWDICGLDIDNSKPHDTPLWDFEQDAAIIRSSFRQAYGLSFDEVKESLPFMEFVTLLTTIPYETPLGKAIYYRCVDTRPKPDKHNKEQVREWDRLHRAFALNKPKDSRTNIERQNAAMDDLALALKESAR